MRTNGTSLLVVKRCSPAGVRLAAKDGRSAPGLLYSTAVRHPLCRRDSFTPPIWCSVHRDWYDSNAGRLTPGGPTTGPCVALGRAWKACLMLA